MPRLPGLFFLVTCVALGPTLLVGSPCLANDLGSANEAGSSQQETPAQTSATFVDLLEQSEWKRAMDHWEQADQSERAALTSIRQPDGMTPLHWAVQHSNQSWVDRLVAAKADVNATNAYSVTPLVIACQSGNSRAAKALIDHGADVNHRVPGRVTSLMLAARAGSPELITLLIDAGADVAATQHSGQSALMWASDDGSVEVVKRLLNAGAAPVRTNDFGFSAWFFAARRGRRDVINLFLQQGVDINTRMKVKKPGGRAPRDRMTALMFAVESGHFELAASLIELGAQPNDQANGYTPLHAVTWVRRAQLGDNPQGDPEPRGSGQLTSLEFVRRAVAMGADVNAKLKRGRRRRGGLTFPGMTPFLLACHTVDLPLMNLLLELGADPSEVNADGVGAVELAAGVGVFVTGEFPGTPDEVEQALRLLVEEVGLDVNHVSDTNETAMHGAAYRSFAETVHLLASLGADPAIWHRKNALKSTPAMVAAGKRPGSFKPAPEVVAAIESYLEPGALPITVESKVKASKEEAWPKPANQAF
ncbi:MAG: ankyrin repeat domain-containing protein [Planctomycetota bacterium]